MIESALNNFPAIITSTPMSAPVLAHSAMDLIGQRAIRTSNQADPSVSGN